MLARSARQPFGCVRPLAAIQTQFWVVFGSPKWLVRVVGIEPTLLAEQDFESCASTSFTTPARGSNSVVA
jgi:hypothetical protein